MKLDLENVIKEKMDKEVSMVIKMFSSKHYGMKTKQL